MKYLFLVLALGLASCGYQSTPKPAPAPAPAGDDGGDDGDEPGPQPQPGAQGNALVQAECGRCHGPGRQAPKVTTVSEFKAVGGAALVRSGRMPTDKRLDQATKTKLLSL